MEKVQKVTEIASQLGSVQDFCQFVDNVHLITKCTDPTCSIKIFNSKLKKEMFDEYLTYDDRRNFFWKYCIQTLTVFRAMNRLQRKGKENLERIN